MVTGGLLSLWIRDRGRLFRHKDGYDFRLNAPDYPRGRVVETARCNEDVYAVAILTAITRGLFE